MAEEATDVLGHRDADGSMIEHHITLHIVLNLITPLAVTPRLAYPSSPHSTAAAPAGLRLATRNPQLLDVLAVVLLLRPATR